MKEVKETTEMKKIWLGFGLIVIGGFLLGRILSKLDIHLGLLGLIGYGMVILGMYIIGEVNKK